MAYKFDSPQKRSTGMLANLLARVLIANQFPTVSEVTLRFFIRGGEAYATSQRQGITEDAH